MVEKYVVDVLKRMILDADMKVILNVISGSEKGRCFQFDQPDTILVGRSKDCHLRLSSDDPYISRRHFLIEICPPRCVLKDLNSSNPPHVNGKKVYETELYQDDVIAAGYTQLQIAIEQDVRIATCNRCGEVIPLAAADTPPDLCSQCMEEEERKQRVMPKPSSDLAIHCINCGKDIGEKANSDGRAKELLGDVEYLCEGCYEKESEINGYAVIGRLGEGGMGKVDLVCHRQTGRLLALKTISKLSGADMVKRFEREVRFTRDLVHENLIRYFDSGIHRREPYLVMQYISDGNLEDMLIARGRPLEAQEAGLCISGVLSGLETMHKNKMIHRDIKPQNILIKKDISGKVIPKITDLGLAKKYSESGGSVLTQRGVAMGTILYMPPEQIRDTRSVREPADLYSVGVTLYYLLTGKFPFDFPTQLEIQELRDNLHKEKSLGELMMFLVSQKRLSPMHIILTEEPIPVRERNPEISKKLARIVDRSVKKEIRKRYQTASEFKKDLLNSI